MANLLTRVPKKDHSLVTSTVRTIYQQPSAHEVHAQMQQVIKRLEGQFPDAASMLAKAAIWRMTPAPGCGRAY